MNSALHRDLARILGEDGVASDAETLARFGGDALGAYRAFRAASLLDGRAAVVAWPTDSAKVARLLRYANSNRMPVVPYGGGTGVMGAAISADGAIVLNMQRMNSVLDVSGADLTAGLQPGVILEDAHVAMKGEGLRLGHDPWSRPIATVGGAISTDGVGYTAAAHGPMGDQVLGLEVVLADGETIRTRAVPKGSYGPSLDRLFIGSEGTLGVVTEATVRAFKRPESRAMRSFVFPEFEAGFGQLSRCKPRAWRRPYSTTATNRRRTMHPRPRCTYPSKGSPDTSGRTSPKRSRFAPSTAVETANPVRLSSTGGRGTRRRSAIATRF